MPTLCSRASKCSSAPTALSECRFLGKIKLVLVYTYLLHVRASCWQRLLQQVIVDELLYNPVNLQTERLAISISLLDRHR